MRCLNCYRDSLPWDTVICAKPKCGVHLPSPMRDVLPPGSRLRARTDRIDYALRRGGFGVTYRGHHTLWEQLLIVNC